ncbi:MAG: glycosyltransferase family 4 protein [Candidatus Berkelbacteria bacterium]|nr:glycosyltransferase family 4 protein [Candidatus Berkelbacteria bacterium]
MKVVTPITIGIDATNLRGGGGVTHLVELLRIAQPAALGIERVVVWGGTPTLKSLDNLPWLDKRVPPELDKGLLQRTLWQRFRLSQAARDDGCDVLFVPGGSYSGNFHPVVTMSQNLLPFEMPELRRYGWSLVRLKLLLLSFTQTRSFRNAEGAIFLTNYARDVVLRVTGKLIGQACIVPHGLNPRFNMQPKPQHVIAEYDDAHPYRVLYVSIIDQYKHQWHVVEAVAALRKQGLAIVLDLVGPAYLPALRRLNATIDCVDRERRWVHYHGAIPFNELHLHYAQADLGLFASSCENMPNILLETMASGLPIACSNRGPMPEVLGDAGVYFDPEQSGDIARALRELIASPKLRAEKAKASFLKAQDYSWERCALDTFAFLAAVAAKHNGSS